MSKFTNMRDGLIGDFTSMVNPLQVIMTDRGDQFVSPEASSAIVSNEGFTGTNASNITVEFNALSAEISAIAEENGIELTPAQKEAGVISAMTVRDPLSYYNVATSLENAIPESGVNYVDVNHVGDYGTVDFLDAVSIEAFDERDLKSAIAASTIYNIAAAKQEDFAETFYPTTVITPDQVGLTQTVTYTTVHGEVRHNLNGEETDFKKRNLIEAFADPTILESKSTKVVPYLSPDGTNEQFFIDPDLLEPREVDIDGVSVTTNALSIGVTMDILGISQAPGILDGNVMDSTDSLDSRLALEQVYLKVSNDTESGLVAFNVLNLARSAFNKSTEGGSNEMELNFRTEALTLRSATTNIAGEVLLSKFGELGNYQIQFSTTLTGTADLETGSLGVYSASLVVSNVWDKTGNSKIAMSDPALKEALEGITFEVIAYDIDAYRTNTNIRTRGTILDTETVSEGYKVRLGPPIAVPAPINGAGRTGVDLKSLISASHTRTSNNAVTALLNFISRMKVYSERMNGSEPVPSVEGIARFLIRPVYREKTVDLLKVVDSEKTSEKADDIRAALVEAIRHEIYHMIVDSNYQIALDFDTGVTGSTPKVIIGTDPILERYIIEYGDNRTLSAGMTDFKITTTHDVRVKNKIILTFTRDGREADPLSFGTHVYMPELTTTVQVTRNGATVKENQVQPRDLHVNNLPIIAVIYVENLEEIIYDKVGVKVDEDKVVSPSNGNGNGS